MGDPPAGLPPGAFASAPQHLNPYPRFSTQHQHQHQHQHPHQHQHQHPQVQVQVRVPPRQQPQSQEAFASHLDTNLQQLDHNTAFQQSFEPQLDDIDYVSQYSPVLQQQIYNGGPSATPIPHHRVSGRVQEVPSHPGSARRASDQVNGVGHLGVLIPQSQLASPSYHPNDAVQRLRQEPALEAAGELSPRAASGAKQGGKFEGMKQILNPPKLEHWRQLLFDVDEPIELTEEEFQTYFPHIDNVYSHRSTQGYKRQPLKSHYWDCRLKGRPPGTPKSDDPNKRKRKRQARERDLCDVKIKITEFFPNARQLMSTQKASNDNSHNDLPVSAAPLLRLGLISPDRPVPGEHGERYYKIERVNGNGGNGKADGVAGPHKHTLEESDKIKANSIQREILKGEKERKKQNRMNTHRATGSALTTVRRHLRDDMLKFHASCSDARSQAIWIALELKSIPYQYIEAQASTSVAGHVCNGGANGTLHTLNLSQQVPRLLRGSSSRSGILSMLLYLNRLSEHNPFLPDDEDEADAIRGYAETILTQVPDLYYTILGHSGAAGDRARMRLRSLLDSLVEVAEGTGPFFRGPNLGLVDIVLAPWILRFRIILKPYRLWPDPEPGSRWATWVQAVESQEAVKRTVCTDDLYKECIDKFLNMRSMDDEGSALEAAKFDYPEFGLP